MGKDFPCPVCRGSGKISLNDKTLGQQLKTLRELKGMSLRDVEKSIGKPNASVIHKIETGKTEHMAFATIMKLCQLYGINPKDLALPESKVQEPK